MEDHPLPSKVHLRNNGLDRGDQVLLFTLPNNQHIVAPRLKNFLNLPKVSAILQVHLKPQQIMLEVAVLRE